MAENCFLSKTYPETPEFVFVRLRHLYPPPDRAQSAPVQTDFHTFNPTFSPNLDSHSTPKVSFILRPPEL